MSNAGRPVTFKPDQLTAMLDQLWSEGVRRPTYRACVARGYRGCRLTFNKTRNPWMLAKGQPLVNQVQRQNHTIKPEPRVHRGKPYVPPQELTTSQRAIADGYAAMKRLGLMGGKAK